MGFKNRVKVASSTITMRDADGVEIRKKLIAAGVKNLRSFGYPDATDENILTDQIYKAFFNGMLADNLGKSAAADPEITKLIGETA